MEANRPATETSSAPKHDDKSRANGLDLNGAKQWLASEVTLRLPGWALAAGAVVALILLLVALD